MSTKLIPFNDFIFFKEVKKEKVGFDTSFEPRLHDAKTYEIIEASNSELKKGDKVIIKDCIRAIIPMDNCKDEVWCCQLMHVMAKIVDK